MTWPGGATRGAAPHPPNARGGRRGGPPSNALPFVAVQPSHPHPRPQPCPHPQVFKAASALESEADVAPLEALISEATKELDKAVSKGVLHKNTVARRKSRLADAKRAALVKCGLYTPA